MLNKVILMGRLTRDPELTVAQSGVSVAKFTLAVDRKFVKQGEERQADFINCVAFRQTADFLKKFFFKGQLTCVTGSIQTRTWETDGKKYYGTDIIVDEVNFTGDKRENNNNGGYQQNNNYNQQNNNSSYQQSNNQDGYVPDVASSDDGFMTVHEDQLPF